MVNRLRDGIVWAALAAAAATGAFADVSGTANLTANQTLNLDTGSTGSSGGDLLWNGSTLAPQGSATAGKLPGGSGASFYGTITQSLASAFSSLLGKTALTVAQNDILIVHTNGANYAKLLVTSISGGTLALQYTTFGASSTPTMTITAVENAATNIPPGLPNAAIAQGAMFVVKGTLLGPANIAIQGAFPFTTSIGGTSVNVTVGGTSVDAIMFYSLAGQIAAILPSKTPTGTGTLKVTYNGQSATAPITVVQSNFGMYTLSQSGMGDAVAYLNSNSTLITPTNAANPGDVVIFWGTGLGPVSSDETQPAVQSDMTNVPIQVFIGGKPANVLFRGRNGCCTSVDTVYVTIPQGVSGCAVSVVMQIGNQVSNGTTIAVAPSGRACTLTSQITGGNLSLYSGTHSFGEFSLARSVQTTTIGGNTQTTKSDSVGATFTKVTYSANQQALGSQIDVNSYGSCTMSFSIAGQTTSPGSSSIQYLDAGPALTLNLPAGGSKSVPKLSAGSLLAYSAALDQTATTLTAGSYQITGPGGPDVGAFSASYTMPQPFVWSNQTAVTSVARANGVTVNWSGGDPAGYVEISGSSSVTGGVAGSTVSASFTCTAKASDGSFTVPSAVLLALPAGSGNLSLSHFAGTTATTPPTGIEFFGISSFFNYGSTVSYQ